MKRICRVVLTAIVILTTAGLAFAQNCGSCSFHQDAVARILADLKDSSQDSSIQNGTVNYSTNSSPSNMRYHLSCARKVCNSAGFTQIKQNVLEIEEIRRELSEQPIVGSVDPAIRK